MSRLLEPTEAPTGARSVSASYEKRLMLTAGRASTELGGKIAEKLGVEPIDAGLKTFPDGEVYCRYADSIRGADIFIVQSICGSEREGLTVNDAFMDLHAGQTQGFFSKTVDHMTAMPILTQFVTDRLVDEDLVVIAPDAGRVKLVRNFARKVGAPYALLEKERPAQGVAEIGKVIG